MLLMSRLTIWQEEIKFNMTQEEKTLLIEQANKLSEVLEVLNKEFSALDIDDERNFLAIVKENLSKIALD